MGKKRPIAWLDQASPEEIGEALLAVDEVKAAKVMTYLGSRLAPELERVVENARERLEHDPVGAIGGALLGLARGGQRR